jgi:hypothetical protein
MHRSLLLYIYEHVVTRAACSAWLVTCVLGVRLGGVAWRGRATPSNYLVMGTWTLARREEHHPIIDSTTPPPPSKHRALLSVKQSGIPHHCCILIWHSLTVAFMYLSMKWNCCGNGHNLKRSVNNVILASFGLLACLLNLIWCDWIVSFLVAGKK